jgi:ATP-dependent protease ClpP protease subunit
MQRDYQLYEQIEMWHVAHLDTFLSELEQAGARTATIRLNSPGGSWLAGQMMRGRILSSKLRITTVNEGLVGSAATLPYAAGAVRQCQAHAKFMMHQVSGEVSGQIKDLRKAVAAQEALNRSTAEMYVAASTKTVEEWEQMMEAETWLGAEAAKTMGFCTECLPAKPGLVAADATMAAADVHKYYMSLIPKNTEMKLEDVKNALGKAGVKLADNATEAEVISAIEKLKNEAPAALVEVREIGQDPDIAELKRQLKELKDARANEQTQHMEEVLNSAVGAGKITAAQKPSYQALLTADFTNTAKILGEMPGRQSVASRANQAASTATGTDTRNDWDFDKWSKEDEKGLLALKRNDPDKYQNLVASIK